MASPIPTAVPSRLCSDFGSMLNLNCHAHALVPDGVFAANSDGSIMIAAQDARCVKVYRRTERGEWRDAPDVYRDGERFELPRLTRTIAVDEVYDDILDGAGRSLFADSLAAAPSRGFPAAPPRCTYRTARHHWAAELEVRTFQSPRASRRC